MGAQWSHIVNSRPDNLLFPPEVVERITEKLSVRDRLDCRLVCKEWNDFLLQSPLLHEMKVVVQDSDSILTTMVNSPLSGFWANYSLRQVEPSLSSAQFWSVCGPYITSIDFHDVFLKSSMNTRIDENEEFYGICPNLRHLGLTHCNRFFMMGGKYCQVLLSSLFRLGNLESLDLSGNKYLKDSILFSLLSGTNSLTSLNLSDTPISFNQAVFNRFYPQAAQAVDDAENVTYSGMSDDILSFQAFYRWFLCTDKASCLTELSLDNTNIEERALSLLADSERFHWEKICLNRCVELKPLHLQKFVASQGKLKKLELGMVNLKAGNIRAMEMSQIEHLVLFNNGVEDLEIDFFENSPSLKYLDMMCSYSVVKSISLPYASNLQVFKLCGYGTPMPVPKLCIDMEAARSILQLIPQLGNLRVFILDTFNLSSPFHASQNLANQIFQSIIWYMTRLEVLRISSPTLTDLGVAGTYIDEYDPRLPPGAVKRLREKYKENLANDPEPGLCISSLQNLKELGLIQCTDLREATWRKALNLPYLTSLDLSNCTQISQPGMMSIIASCRNLESIKATGCGEHISRDPEIIEALRVLPRMRTSAVQL